LFEAVLAAALIASVLTVLPGTAGEPGVPAAESEAAASERYKVQEEKIYYGDPKNFRNPAVLDAAKIYNEIPAYQKIIQKGLTRNDPEYWPLMQKASNVFVRALKAVCKEKGIDLVGEVSSITCESAAVPEITEAVIAAVRENKLAAETECDSDPEGRIVAASASEAATK